MKTLHVPGERMLYIPDAELFTESWFYLKENTNADRYIMVGRLSYIMMCVCVYVGRGGWREIFHR